MQRRLSHLVFYHLPQRISYCRHRMADAAELIIPTISATSADHDVVLAAGNGIAKDNLAAGRRRFEQFRPLNELGLPIPMSAPLLQPNALVWTRPVNRYVMSDQRQRMPGLNLIEPSGLLIEHIEDAQESPRERIHRLDLLP